MPIEVNVPLSKDYILSKVTQEQIMEKYLGIPVDLTRSYQNPLREDPYPGCRFYNDKFGNLKFHDFARGWNWDCFNVVQHLNRCSFMEALKIIAADFNTNQVTVSLEARQQFAKQDTKIEIQSEEWNRQNIKFWTDIGVDRDTLRKFNIKSIKAFWINGVRYNVGRQENAYAYCFSRGKIKVYLPDRDFARFYQNCSYLMQGWEQLPKEGGENLIITKSYKDVASLSAFGFDAIAPISEKVLIIEEDFKIIYNKYDNIFVLMDNDWTGKRATMKYITAYSSIIPLLFPADMKKDWSDNVKHYGTQFMIDLIEETKTKLL